MKFKWTTRCKQAFNNLKHRFITAPILTHFNFNFKYIIKTDSSNYTLREVLLQYNKNSELRLVAFF